MSKDNKDLEKSKQEKIVESKKDLEIVILPGEKVDYSKLRTYSHTEILKLQRKNSHLFNKDYNDESKKELDEVDYSQLRTYSLEEILDLQRRKILELQHINNYLFKKLEKSKKEVKESKLKK